MPKAQAVKKYTVLNPNNLPPEIHVISWQDYIWYAGNEFIPPPGLNIERLLLQGYIVEVSG